MRNRRITPMETLGVQVDKTPYTLSQDIAYLAEKMTHYDIVVACQAVIDVYRLGRHEKTATLDRTWRLGQ
ncbi:MAG: hypothetical protein U0350_17355 [Caldilineaceae bacterium]